MQMLSCNNIESFILVYNQARFGIFSFGLSVKFVVPELIELERIIPKLRFRLITPFRLLIQVIQKEYVLSYFLRVYSLFALVAFGSNHVKELLSD
jgi:hypothetical protein